jgi:hypothetical protein
MQLEDEPVDDDNGLEAIVDDVVGGVVDVWCVKGNPTPVNKQDNFSLLMALFMSLAVAPTPKAILSLLPATASKSSSKASKPSPKKPLPSPEDAPPKPKTPPPLSPSVKPAPPPPPTPTRVSKNFEKYCCSTSLRISPEVPDNVGKSKGPLLPATPPATADRVSPKVPVAPPRKSDMISVGNVSSSFVDAFADEELRMDDAGSTGKGRKEFRSSVGGGNDVMRPDVFVGVDACKVV